MVRGKKRIGAMLIIAAVAAAAFVFPMGKAKTSYATLAEGKCLGIDVSNHNGVIDWAKAKAGGVEFAIIRIGWGDDLYSQDDPLAEYNMQQCEKYGIPYGVYIYSYAISAVEVDSEINHTVRMIRGHQPALGIWFDMEDADGYKSRHNFNPYTHGSELTEFCLRYLRGMKARGYFRTGVYANPDYFRNVLNYSKIKAEGMVWLAHWGVSSPGYDCAMWQYSANGTIAGSGARFDMNLIFAASPLFSLVTGMPQTPEVFTRAEGLPIVYGDVNGDGNISLSDMTRTKMHILGRLALKGDAFTCADVNRDGKVSLSDLTLMKKHILKKIDLTVEEETAAEPETMPAEGQNTESLPDTAPVEDEEGAEQDETAAEPETLQD